MMRKENEVLEQLRAAESLIGTPTTEMFGNYIDDSLE